MSSTHDFERRALTEFFTEPNANKPRHPLHNQVFYEKLRNSVISIYNNKSHYYMSASSLLLLVSTISLSVFKQNYEMSMDLVIKCHLFWSWAKLINYRAICLDPISDVTAFTDRANPHKEKVPFTEWLESLLSKPFVGLGETPPISLNPTQIKTIHEYTCSICHSKCFNSRYRGIYPLNATLCLNCFKDGLFPANLTSGQFVRVSGPVDFSEPIVEWTDDEILLLLDGVDEFGDDWRRVSDKVKTRNVEECIGFFAGMNYKNSVNVGNIKGVVMNGEVAIDEDGNAVTDAHNAVGNRESPVLKPLYNSDEMEPGLKLFIDLFICCENPLMSFLSIVSKAIVPAIAAAGARAALDFITKKYANEPETFQSSAEENVQLLTVALYATVNEARIYSIIENERVKGLFSLLFGIFLGNVEEKIEALKELKEFETKKRIADLEAKEVPI